MTLQPLAHRFVLAALLAAPLAAAGCSGDTAPPFNPDDPRLMTARLEFVSMQAQTLRFSARTELAVRYVYEDGTPIGGAPLTFTVEGDAAGSTLSARSSDTAGDGSASVNLTAGTTNASFRVAVTPPQGDAVAFDIAIVDTDAGGIVVQMSYAGMTALDRFRPFLFRGLDCTRLDPMRLPTADRAGAPVTRVTDRPSFAGVAIASDWAVVVVGDYMDSPRVFGCVANIPVMSGMVSTVAVALRDINPPTRFVGVYDLDNRLDFGGVLPPSVERAVDLIDELTDDQDVDGDRTTMDYGQDPGAFILDFAMRETCHWECRMGEDFGSCSEINHATGDISALYLQDFTRWSGAQSRFFGGCGAWETAAVPAQNLINDQVAMYLPDAVVTFSNIAGDLARAINQAHIYSVLTLSPPVGNMVPLRHDLERMEVPLHRLDGTETTFAFNLADVGLTSIRASVMATVDGNRLIIPAHMFDFDFGVLVQYIYLHGVLRLLGYTSSAEMLADWIDCSAIGRSLASSVGILSETAYRDACSAGLSLAGRALDVSLGGLVPGGSRLTLAGSANGSMLTADRIATRLDMGQWMGSWGEMSMEMDVSGTFTGVRRP